MPSSRMFSLSFVTIHLVLVCLLGVTTAIVDGSTVHHPKRSVSAIATVVDSYKKAPISSNEKGHTYVSSSRQIKDPRTIHSLDHLGLTPPTTSSNNKTRTRKPSCGTYEPTRDKIIHDNKIVAKHVAERVADGNRKAQDDVLIIPTCIHVIRPDGDTLDDYLNIDMIQQQLDGLNQGFSSSSCCDSASYDWCNTFIDQCSIETGIKFQLATFDPNDNTQLLPSTEDQLSDAASSVGACVTRTFNDYWYYAESLSDGDIDMRISLRRGDAKVLNVYFKAGEFGLLGIAQFPSDYATQSLTDGVLVGDAYVIGGPDPLYSEGATLVHEVGHWLGLFHTFQGGCEGGDLVGDTAPEKTEAVGCEIGRDTCPGGGRDPIHNYMDYSDDHCLFEFTESQIDRMKAQYNLYRSGLRQLVDLSNGVQSIPTNMEQYELQTYRMNVSPGNRVECTSSANGGDIDMYVSDGEEPILFLGAFNCASQFLDSFESCSVLANSDLGAIYVSLYAYKATVGAVVTCTTSEIEAATVLQDGQLSDAFSLGANQEILFTLDITEPNSRIVCLLEGGAGDEIFSLRFDQPPDLSTGDYDCISLVTPRCTVVDSGFRSVLWAAVTSSGGASSLSFGCFSSVPNPIELLSANIPTGVITLGAYEAQTFLMTPPSGSVVTCETSSVGTGNMFLKWNSAPDLSIADYDCSDFNLSRSCTVTEPGWITPSLFVTVEALGNGLSSLELTCDFAVQFTLIQDGVPTQPFDLLEGASRTFGLAINRGDSITCNATAANPEEDSFDLYLSFDPSALESGCQSVSFTGNEECTVEDTGTSTVVYATVQSFPPAATDVIVTCTITPSTTEFVADVIALTDGIPSNPFSLGELFLQSFTLDVAPGAKTTCSTEGFDGDADLYLRYNEESDVYSGFFDCSSINIGSFENCTVRDPGTGGVLWATVEAFNAFTDLTITCTSIPLGPPIILESGVPSGPYSLDDFEDLDLVLSVEPNERVFCNTTGVGGDTDLIMAVGREAYFFDFDFDCYGERFDSEETCAVVVPDGESVVWVELFAFNATDELVITCTSSVLPPPPPPISLTTGVTSDPISLETDLSQSYTFDVTPGTRVTCILESLSSRGDADLYLRFDEAPDVQTWLYDCISADTFSQETCSLDVPSGVSTLWATIYAYSIVEDTTITCSSEDTVGLIRLFDGQAAAPLSLSAGMIQTFQLAVPPGENVVCETRLLATSEFADADLFVRIDAEPNLVEALYDCSSAGIGSLESCTLNNVAAGSTLFAVVEAYTEFTDLILTCSSYAQGSVQEAVKLIAGLPSEPFGLNTLQIQDFTFETPDELDATCTLAGDSGDADLFLRWSDPPVIDGRIHQFDCASQLEFSAEACSVVNPGNATVLWARVFAYQSFEGVTITCASTLSGDDTPAPVPDAEGDSIEPAVQPTAAPTADTPATDDPTATPSLADEPIPTPIPTAGSPDLVVPTDPTSGGPISYLSFFGISVAFFCLCEVVLG